MCFDLTTHSQMLSFEDCTIRLAQDQSLNPFVSDIDQENQAMNHSDLKTIEFAAYIGQDWADQKHDICLQENHSHRVESLRLDHKPDAISNWAAELRQREYTEPFSERVKRIRKCWWRLGGCKSSPGATTLQGDHRLTIPPAGFVEDFHLQVSASQVAQQEGPLRDQRAFSNDV